MCVLPWELFLFPFVLNTRRGSAQDTTGGRLEMWEQGEVGKGDNRNADHLSFLHSFPPLIHHPFPENSPVGKKKHFHTKPFNW